MASLEEVWGSPFPKKHHSMLSKQQNNGREDHRDAEKEGRIAPTPMRRTADAIQKNRKTIDDLSKTLPIVESDEQADTNYAPARVSWSSNREGFTATKKEYSNPYSVTDFGTSFAYAPPQFQEAAHEIKLNRILRLIEQNRTGYETPSSHDMALYVFTGVMALFVLDTFVNLGRRLG